MAGGAERNVTRFSEQGALERFHVQVDANTRVLEDTKKTFDRLYDTDFQTSAQLQITRGPIPIRKPRDWKPESVVFDFFVSGQDTVAAPPMIKALFTDLRITPEDTLLMNLSLSRSAGLSEYRWRFSPEEGGADKYGLDISLLEHRFVLLPPGMTRPDYRDDIPVRQIELENGYKNLWQGINAANPLLLDIYRGATAWVPQLLFNKATASS